LSLTRVLRAFGFAGLDLLPRQLIDSLSSRGDVGNGWQKLELLRRLQGGELAGTGSAFPIVEAVPPTA